MFQKRNMSAPFIHESSYVDDNVQVGAGTKIWHFCHVQSGAVIGENCSLGQNVNVANNVRIGNGVRIQNNVSIYEGVELEDHVFCGPSCVFTNVNTPRAHFPVHGVYARTRVCEGASLGANCTIVCGHTIGRSAMIAAGAVVTKGTIVEPYSLMAGVPAKCIKKLPETNMKTIHNQAIKYKTLWTEGYGILPDADGESYHGEKIMD